MDKEISTGRNIQKTVCIKTINLFTIKKNRRNSQIQAQAKRDLTSNVLSIKRKKGKKKDKLKFIKKKKKQAYQEDLKKLHTRRKYLLIIYWAKIYYLEYIKKSENIGIKIKNKINQLENGQKISREFTQNIQKKNKHIKRWSICLVLKGM